VKWWYIIVHSVLFMSHQSVYRPFYNSNQIKTKTLAHHIVVIAVDSVRLSTALDRASREGQHTNDALLLLHLRAPNSHLTQCRHSKSRVLDEITNSGCGVTLHVLLP
jgi:hypothetical protein